MTPVFPQPFDVKTQDLLHNKVKGYAQLHPDCKEMLEFICEVSRDQWHIRPMVTDFGRTRCDQEAIYLPVYLQSLQHQGLLVADPVAREQAEDLARDRFSWHVIDSATGFFRAFDLRDWIYIPAQRIEIMRQVRLKYPTAEVLDHRVQGGGQHFHFGLPDPLGRPHNWV